MTHFRFPSGRKSGWIAAFVALIVGGCSGNLGPILGSPGVGSTPSITSTSPATSNPPVQGVSTSVDVRATFSQPMNASTLTTSFTLACPSGAPVTASVTYDAPSQTAILTPAEALPANTLCEATVSSAATDSAGFALAADYVWSFMTAVSGDVTRPTVVVTVPADAASGVPTNTAVSAAFSEDMAPATINDTTFTLSNTTLGVAVTGTVSYSVASRSATFTPATLPLASNSTFTATITSAATDLAGNGLAGDPAALPAASDHVWTFTTSASGDTTPPTVISTNPVDGSIGVCLTKSVTATFSESMNPATIGDATFGVSAAGVAVPGTVSYDIANRIAIFAPTAISGFAASTPFVATVNTGVTDLAGNAMVADKVWGFTTGTQACVPTIPLGGIASFGTFGGGAGVTNQGINTTVQGDLGTTAACTLVTGFHDALNVYTETPLNVGAVNGAIDCAPPPPGTPATLAIATKARADARTAFDTMAALPAGSDPGAGELGGLTLAPAIYSSALGTFGITAGDLTLDAQGDSDARWIFQCAAGLTVGLPATPRHVLLVNGARAANVYWQVGSAARIEDGSVMVGTIIAPAGVTISTAGQTIQTTLVGRAIGLDASVTIVNTTITAP